MKCEQCNKREATENWVGQGDTLAFVHGFYKRWCKKCCLEAQIEYCEKELRELPERIKKLKEELGSLPSEGE